MPFLPPNQQRQSTEGKNINTHTRIVVQNEKKKKERGGRICGCVKCGRSIRLVTVFVVACEVARWHQRDRRDSTLSHTLSETRSVTAIFHYTDPTRPDQTRPDKVRGLVGDPGLVGSAPVGPVWWNLAITEPLPT